MIIQLNPTATKEQRLELDASLSQIGYVPNPVTTSDGAYLVCIGKKEFDIRLIGNLPAVKDVHRVKDAYKLVSRSWKVHPTTIDLGDGLMIGDGSLCLMAGPCSIENEVQVETILKHLKSQGVKVMRGGVYKPRTSPYAFRGMGIEGLKMFSDLAKQYGIRIITEVMQVEQVEAMEPYTDIFQVGARNSQNFNLLDSLGQVGKPVLIKRALSGTLEELLQSAEYVFSRGNEKLILCERGIRTFETAYRNTFDINAIPILKEKSHLPVVADPSHGVGVRRHVAPIALAAAAAGADGILLEIHPEPEKAASDGQQTLDFEESAKLFGQLAVLRKLC
jgi:3-deoxy-7-phosphoheptulonate synthase